jgi:GNAT superfamily N-acetyltransferase
MLNELIISIESTHNTQLTRKIEEALSQYNRQYALPDRYTPLNVFAHTQDGEVVAGLLAETYWGWLHVRILWVDDEHRNLGLGKRLLTEAEKESLRRGCHNAHLDTHDFQAEAFYKKNGYEVFGILDDLPQGHKRIYLKKKLSY